MYKLVVIGGKLRGKDFTLEDGENIAGRDSGCDIHLPLESVSKKHFSLTVSGQSCYLKDLGSSNGTFLNGKVVRNATIKDKDKIALPDLIIQVVFVKEKKILVKKYVANEEDDEERFMEGGAPPGAPLEKFVWVVKYKIMKHLYGLNEEYEWRHLIPFLLFIFTLVSVTLVIFPVMESNKKLLINEIAERGHHYIQELARINTEAMSNREIEKIDTEWITRKDEGTEGVIDYRLMDMEGRIVRPSTKLNEYVRDPHFVKSWEMAKSLAQTNTGRAGRPFVRSIASDTILIGKSIWAFNQDSARQEPIGIVAIKFAPKSLKEHARKINSNFLEALVTLSLAATVLFGIFYFITLRSIEELHYQMEEGLGGKRGSVKSRYLFSELSGLKNSIDTSLQRIRELDPEESSDVMEEESDEKYVAILHEFMQGGGGPIFVLDSQKRLSYINLEAEDLCGIRESASQGVDFLDVSREQGFAATVIELCDNSANSDGSHQQGEYELTGINHKINVISLMGKDGFAKAFYVTLVKDE